MPERIGLETRFEVAAFNDGLQVYLRGLIQATSQTESAASGINAAGVGIAAGFGAALGTAAVQAISAFVSAAGEAISSAVELAVSFERLQFSIGSLIAVQELQKGSLEDVNTLFERSGQVAEGYLLLLEDMAIPSIFTTQQIGSVERMIQVFGFGVDQAFEWTKRLTDFGTTGNVTPEILDRIAYALGQVRTENRLLATEAKQFANATIPIYEIVATSLNKTVSAVRQMGKEGELSFDIVAKALAAFFDNFEGATSRSAKTLTGFLSQIQDVKEILTANFTRALLAPVLEFFNQFTSLFTSDTIRAGATALGEILGEQLGAAVRYLNESLLGLFSTIAAISPQIIEFGAVFAIAVASLLAFSAAVGIIALAVNLLITPFTLAIAAIAAFAAAYATNFGNVRTITDTIVSTIITTVGNVVDAFSDTAQGIGQALSTAATYLANFLGEVVEWGSSIVQSLADGITSAVDVVISAIGVLGEAMAYLMAPGSAPRFLPHLTDWGKGAADAYLSGFTQADFGALNELGNFIEQALKIEAGKSPVANLIISVQQSVASAVSEIRQFGQVTGETFASITRIAGKTSDEIFGYLNRFRDLTIATTAAEKAQKSLNDITEKYDALITPLQQKLAAAGEAKQQLQESREVAGLRRLLESQGVSGNRKAEARARLEEILARQQLATLQLQKETETDKAQAELDAAEKTKTAAQEQLDLFNQRLQIQNQYISLLDSEANKLSKASEARQKALAKELTPLERQLKLMQLQKAEASSIVAEAKARAVLEDENSTALQKAQAQMTLLEIIYERQARDVEAQALGFAGALENVRKIKAVLADIEKAKAGGKKDKPLGGISDFALPTDADAEGRLKKFREEVDRLKESFGLLSDNITGSAKAINDNLPTFLQFFGPDNKFQMPPAFQKAKEVLGGLAAAFAASKIAPILLNLGKLFTKTNLITFAVGTLASAWIGNWYNIREKTYGIIAEGKRRLEEFYNSPAFQGLITKLAELKRAVLDSMKPDTGSSGEPLPAQTGLLDNLFSEQSIVDAKQKVLDVLKRIFDPEPADMFNFATFMTTLGGNFLASFVREFGKILGLSIQWFLGTFLPGLIKGIGGIAVFLFNAIFVFDQGAAREAIGRWRDELVAQIKENVLPALGDAGRSVADGFTKGWAEFLQNTGINDAIAALGTWWQGVLAWFGIGEGTSTKAKDEAGMPIGQGVVQGIVDFWQGAIEIVTGALSKLIGDVLAVATVIEAWRNAGLRLAGTVIGTVVSFVSAAGQSLIDAFSALISAVFTLETFDKFSVEAQKIGDYIVDGIKKGIEDNVFKPVKAIKDALATILFGAQEEIDAKSPSKKFYDKVGVPIAEGIANGANSLDTKTLFDLIRRIMLEALTSLKEEAISLMGTTSEQAQAIIATLATNLTLTVSTMLTEITLLFTAFQLNTQTTFSAWAVSLYQTFATLATNLLFSTLSMSLEVSAAYATLQANITLAMNTMSSDVQKTFSDLHTALSQKMDAIIKMINEKIAQLLLDLQTNFVAKGKELGEDFASGIEKGILDKLGAIVRAARKVVSEAVSAAQEELDAHSPSGKTANEIGEPFGAGISQGILDSMGQVTQSISTVISRMLDTTMSGLSKSNLSQLYPSTVSNVSTVKNYNLNVNSAQQSRGVVYDFGIMEVMNSA